MPRSQALPLRSYICHASATIRIWLAAVPSRRVQRKRRKLAENLGGAAAGGLGGIG